MANYLKVRDHDIIKVDKMVDIILTRYRGEGGKNPDVTPLVVEDYIGLNLEKNGSLGCDYIQFILKVVQNLLVDFDGEDLQQKVEELTEVRAFLAEAPVAVEPPPPPPVLFVPAVPEVPVGEPPLPPPPPELPPPAPPTNAGPPPPPPPPAYEVFEPEIEE